MAGNTFQTWYLFLDMMMEVPKQITDVLREEYHKQLKERWGECIFPQQYKVQDLAQTFEAKLGENHKQIASAQRTSLEKVLENYNFVRRTKEKYKTEFELD